MKKNDHVSLEKVNKKIQQIKQDVDAMNLIRPHTAFITF